MIKLYNNLGSQNDVLIKEDISNDFLGGINKILSAEQGKFLDNKKLDKFNFSENEQKTGLKWIDGKDIYCKIISKSNIRIENNTSIKYEIPNINTIICYQGFRITQTKGNIGTFSFPIIEPDGTSISLRVDTNIIKFVGNSYWNAFDYVKYVFYIFYTKN